MMSVWIEIFGWCCIAAGTWLTSSAIRTLLRLIRVGKDEGVEPDLRRRAWRNVVFGPLAFTWGVFWVSYRWLHDTLIWLPFAYVVMMVIWNVGSWFWLRNKDRAAASGSG
jgi:hypothetical protein